MRLSSVTFDLDGTLLDTATDLLTACNRMLAELDRPPRAEAEIRRFVGTGAETLVERCLTRENMIPSETEIADGVAIFRRCYREENGRTAKPFPNVLAGLAAWQASGLPLAVVTNKNMDFTMPLLEQTGLARFFTVVIGGDSTPCKKPHPEPIFAACRQMGAIPAENLHIGDSINDVRAARAAGSLAWLVPYGYTEGRPIDGTDCDRLVADLLEAFRAFARAFPR
ncbi:MAG: phosphoglycolate phosphatase [Zoogloeaceae bacterium]|jgi:phosphoglycolate phosphatase|nr:phosphoglycolate phosphatase [Zoogloeaceae bacterium]